MLLSQVASSDLPVLVTDSVSGLGNAVGRVRLSPSVRVSALSFESTNL